jgi:hypothetical protein
MWVWQGVFGRRHLPQPPPGYLCSASAAEAVSFGKPRFQFGFDLNEILRLGVEVARMRPLEARLEHASDPPIGIAEMIVDGRMPARGRHRRRVKRLPSWSGGAGDRNRIP